MKFILGIVFAMPVLLWSYDKLVRPTWLGVVLNGKRQPRWSDQAEPIAIAA